MKYDILLRKKYLNARNQVKSAKPKMWEHKLKSCVNWQRVLHQKKRCKTKGRKTRAGFTCILYNGILYECVLRTSNVNIIVCSVGRTVYQHHHCKYYCLFYRSHCVPTTPLSTYRRGFWVLRYVCLSAWNCCMVHRHCCCVVDRHYFFFFLREFSMHRMLVISLFPHVESSPFCNRYYLFTFSFLSKQTRHGLLFHFVCMWPS